jgi:phosphatidylethanolamine/phosphatidyl-N-methylethanolamine N-methyltransferase
MRDNVRFLGGFLRGPGHVGAVAPSSRFLAREMVKGCALRSAKTVVELGPGTGSFTRAIADGISDETTFMALERDPVFADTIEERFPDVLVYNDSAERLPHYLALNGKVCADCILSGLPWASFPRTLQLRILEAVLASLGPGAPFVTFAYIHALWLPTARRFRRTLHDSFTTVEQSRVVWANFPPAIVYRCRR